MSDAHFCLLQESKKVAVQLQYSFAVAVSAEASGT